MEQIWETYCLLRGLIPIYSNRMIGNVLNCCMDIGHLYISHVHLPVYMNVLSLHMYHVSLIPRPSPHSRKGLGTRLVSRHSFLIVGSVLSG